MKKKLNITKNNSKDLGFAIDCLYEIINFDEFKQWIYYVIEVSDIEDVPSFIFDILDIKYTDKDNPKIKAIKIIGFTPGWDLRKEEYEAMKGIAYRRNPNYHSDIISREEALKALEKTPHIEKRFREIFPFIDW